MLTPDKLTTIPMGFETGESQTMSPANNSMPRRTCPENLQQPENLQDIPRLRHVALRSNLRPVSLSFEADFRSFEVGPRQPNHEVVNVD